MKKLAVTIFIFLPIFIFAQEKRKQTQTIQPVNIHAFDSIKFRNIGPFRGGRTNAVHGLVNDPMTYYMGTVGGGVYKTTNSGNTWKNITDGFLNVGSIGAIAVSESDPNIIYVGTGEHAVRGVMSSHGDGIYKSLDAGISWKHMGLKSSRHISRIRIHPSNPNLVFAAVQGSSVANTEERGIYKSIDGGQSWKKVLFINLTTGAADLSMDMNMPSILYASMWDHHRLPWTMRSGGPGSGVYKSVDAGETWVKLEKGLPKEMGKISVDVSRANSNILYANIEADQGGVCKSNDAGNSWKQVNKDRVTIARAWYYIEIYADPQNEDVVYVMNAPYLKSIDGGKTFTPIGVPHGDQHDLWINPLNNKNIINSNDGGANITFDNGKSWSQQNNQSTAQFYRVIADNRFPYHIYGGQQDNSAIAIASRTNGRSIGSKDWYSVAGGESAFIAFDPNQPDLVYGGSYQGNISTYNQKIKTRKDIMHYPVVGLGTVPKDMKYRFNWNAPIVASIQDPSIIYHGGNVVLKTSNQGLSWEEISPDLTRNDTTKQGPGGTPFTNEGAGGENYNTISYIACSPYQKGVLWVGTDDGLIHLTKDDGKNWKNISPNGLGECLINSIEISPHTQGTAYVAVTKYKFNDFTPLIYLTKDFGATWNLKTSGIANEDYVRVVRADKRRKGLLYAGTEKGLYISFNNGDTWQKSGMQMPITPINDLYIQDNDLILATAGRGFWILDDLSFMQQWDVDNSGGFQIFKPKASYKYGLNTSRKAPSLAGQNPLAGVIIDYFLPAKMDSSKINLIIKNAEGDTIRMYTNKKNAKKQGMPLLTNHQGLNRINWDLRKGKLPEVKGVKVFLGGGNHTVAPGNYTMELNTETDTLTSSIKILADPNLQATNNNFLEQEKILNQIEDAHIDIHNEVNRMREVKAQLESWNSILDNVEGTDSLIEVAGDIMEKINNWEAELIQPKQKTFQDVINFPNQLNVELLNLMSRADGHEPKVNAGVKNRLSDLLKEWGNHKEILNNLISVDVANFNAYFKTLEIPALIIPKKQ